MEKIFKQSVLLMSAVLLLAGGGAARAADDGVNDGTLVKALETAANDNRTVKAVLKDSQSGDAVAFATVSLTKPGTKTPYKYILSDDKGNFTLEKVAAGKYTLKVELLGYKTYEKEISVNGALDLGTIKMETDQQAIDAATVSTAGNPIIIKKDTVEYNASSFKTTENDMLVDLLKKLPGIEVGSDGSITANGKSISKITINGKTFFLNDPSLASSNIPAKIIDKVKVLEKKSEQAEFTGIEDGNDETVIDLSVRRGMMNGLFGNVMGGVGHDIPENTSSEVGDNKGDWRYQGSAFIGDFTEKSQLSIIANGNNANNRGFNDMAGGMMRGAMGGGGGMGRGGGGFGGSGNGIVTSWMGGVNGSKDLLDGDLSLEGNYLYNGTKTDVEERSLRRTYLDDYNLIYNNNGYSHQNTYGNRAGARIDYKLSKNTSFLFQPQFNVGGGDYHEFSDFNTLSEYSDARRDTTNRGFTNTTGDSDSWSTSGFLLYRQKLGLPGRTLSFNVDYSLSNNTLNGFNQSLTRNYNYDVSGNFLNQKDSIINQRFLTKTRSRSVSGTLTYTEPLGAGFFVSANYELGYSRSTSDRNTWDSGAGADFGFGNREYLKSGELINADYSNNVVNRVIDQRISAQVMLQRKKIRAQLGFGVVPTYTHNETTGYETYDDHNIKWTPNAQLWYDPNDNTNFRLFYRGSSSQPSTRELMPVLDNSNPLAVSFGNPYLNPYFNHSLRGGYRHTNMKSFSSMNLDFNAGMVQDPIVSATWYGTNGATYNLPVNGNNSYSASLRAFVNTPIAKSNFSIYSMTSGSYNESSSYIGKSTFDTTPYYDGTAFNYDQFHADFGDMDTDLAKAVFTANKTQSMNLSQRLRFTYRNNWAEVTLGGRTSVRKSWYTIKSASTNATWNNQIQASFNFTLPAGFGMDSDLDYNWYDGYATKQDDEFVLNAEITKTILHERVTLALKGYDIFNQAKNLSVSDATNYHTETWNNTLGRYIIFSATFRFGNFGGGMRRGGPGRGLGRGPGRGPMGPPPGGMGPMM